LQIFGCENDQRVGLAKSCIKSRSSSVFKSKQLDHLQTINKETERLFFNFNKIYDSFEK